MDESDIDSAVFPVDCDALLRVQMFSRLFFYTLRVASSAMKFLLQV